MFASYQSGPLPQINNSLPLSRVELTLSCSKLLDLDTFSKSDPQIIVYQQDILSSKWHEIGRTEMIKDNLNPKFATPIVLDYRFEEKQNLRFLVIDIDKEGGKLEEQEIIGTVEISLAEIVGARGQSVTQKIINPSPHKDAGFLTVKAEELNDMKMTVKFALEGHKLDKKDLFGRSDPFIRISKIRPDGQWAVVHKTEVIKNTLNPVWKPFSIPLDILCNGNLDRELLFECYDWNRSGNEDFMGSFKTTLRELQNVGKVRGEIDLIDENKRRRKRSYRNSGTIRMICCDVVSEPSFLDYIRGGCEINLMVAIDFTASNGDPKLATSLHYNTPFKPNEYACAIKSVAEILAAYDTDKLFPTFGFGAKIPPRGQVSHCFPLNGNPNKPEVAGVDGILNAYNETLKNVTLYGPTNFAEIIGKAASYAPHCTQNNQKYVILLIITDGEISDMQSTISQIVRASSLPLSIVIVGVGNDSFAKMVILDADDEPLRADNKVMARDIVQFVPFREYKDSHPSRIAAVTLQEIPEQFLSYFKSRNILPNAPLIYQSNPYVPPMQKQMPNPMMGVGVPPYNLPPNQMNSSFVQQQPLFSDPRQIQSSYPSFGALPGDNKQPFYQQPILQPTLSLDQNGQPIQQPLQYLYQPIYVDQNGQPIQQPFYQQPIYLPQQNQISDPNNNNNQLNNGNSSARDSFSQPQPMMQQMYQPMMQMQGQPIMMISPSGQPIMVQQQMPPQYLSQGQPMQGQPMQGQPMQMGQPIGQGQPQQQQQQPGQPQQQGQPQGQPGQQPQPGQSQPQQQPGQPQGQPGQQPQPGQPQPGQPMQGQPMMQMGQSMGQLQPGQPMPGQPMQMMQPQYMMQPMGQPMQMGQPGQPMMQMQPGQPMMQSYGSNMVQMPVYVAQPPYGSQLPQQQSNVSSGQLNQEQKP